MPLELSADWMIGTWALPNDAIKGVDASMAFTFLNTKYSSDFQESKKLSKFSKAKMSDSPQASQPIGLPLELHYEMAKFIPFDGLKRYCASSYWPSELGMPLLDKKKDMLDKLFLEEVRQLADWYRAWALQFSDLRTQMRQNTFTRMRSLVQNYWAEKGQPGAADRHRHSLAGMANEFEAFYRALGQINDKVNEMQTVGTKDLLDRFKLEPSTCDEYLKCRAKMLAPAISAAENEMAMWRNEEVQRWQEMFWGFGALLRDDFPQEFAFCLHEFAMCTQHIYMTESLLKVCAKLQFCY